MTRIWTSGSFDDLKSRHVRFLQEAARRGETRVLLWSDDVVRSLERKDPKFPQEERRYLLESLRYVNTVTLCTGPLDPDALPSPEATRPDMWVVGESSDTPAKRAFCQSRGLSYEVLTRADLAGFPDPIPPAAESFSPRRRVIVSGCFDWFHSGHVRFLEEVSQFGDLYVIVGHDANIRSLKGEGHPLFSQEERRYMVGAVRWVRQAVVSTGHGWLDAEPEIRRIQPHIYAVNEDGDRPEKREYCRRHGIEYVVLKRLPKEGLPRRESTILRGF
jgi:cytidyltransferase-like protein